MSNRWLSHSVVIALLLTLTGCEFHGLTCWNRLKYLHSELDLELDELGETSEEDVARIRAAISENVETCRSSAFYKNLSPGDDSGLEAIFTLLDFAIMADDVELTAEMYDRQMTELSPEFRREELLSEDEYLTGAVYYESDAVVRWLLDNGDDANERDEHGWTALSYSAARTEGGLLATRALVTRGADLEHENDHGITPLVAAWQRGSLRQVQCLVSLGARIPEPLPEIGDPRSVFIDPYDVERVTEFLSDPERRIPESIAEICSTDTG